ncbi:hypothetical protein CYLTODRAFT_378308 [Cylindrobasidium torrendii FP15055 ss-10]|uniref:Uncharacterized protein n=1 Tax=Cylindrobasidium torrendii FP15055 ss-10 TaxID=1314674 RepID=A0A0D7B6I5_9AGAR|nr:hypothetical protein CYLTODRAFT_378308 [Cylindrobasidium torrendii FP15055 ss-10]
MGQRHQAFVIAKVVPHDGTRAYYRCIVAWHHQWCYGTLPLKATARFIELLKHPNHAAIVRHEIAAIHGKYGRYGQKPAIPHMPCGFTAWLLAQAWEYDLELNSPTEEPYITGTSFRNSLLPAGMGSHGGGNSEGITVIDVTDPMDPAYCFVHGDRLDATGYVRLYYQEGSDEDIAESVDSSIAKLGGVRVLPFQALAEAWPREYKSETTDETMAEVNEDTSQVTNGIPSLASLSIDAAISSNNSTGLQDLFWIPDKAALIAERLRAAPSVPDSAIDTLMMLLHHGMQESNPRVDLSVYSLTPKQTIACVTKIKPSAIASLTVPKSFTVDGVRKLLTIRPAIRRLDLLQTSITKADLAKLLHEEPQIFYHVESLVHELSLLPGPDDTYASEFVPAFSLFHLTHCNSVGGGGFPSASLPLLYPPQVVQALTDYISLFAQENFDRELSLAAKDMVPHVLMGAATREEGVPWSKRYVNAHPKTTSAGLDGAGWVCVLSFPAFGDDNHWYFGFVKMNPKAVVEQDPEKVKTKTRLVEESKNLYAAAAEMEEGEEKEEVLNKANDASYTARGMNSTEMVVVNGDEHLVCGLNEWLAIMKEEGRPVPSDAAVEKLNGIIEEMLQERPYMRIMTLNEIPSMAAYARLYGAINRQTTW